LGVATPRCWARPGCGVPEAAWGRGRVWKYTIAYFAHVGKWVFFKRKEKIAKNEGVNGKN